MPTVKLNRAHREAAEKVEEYFNALRTNVQLSGDNIDVISISSVQPGEGKSTTALNLALAFARTGYQTLLVDADIRNSVMSGVFSTRDKITGLTDYLTGKTDLSEGLCDTDVENLYVIQSGPVSPNPTGLLQSQNFNKMISILRKYYDYIIIDTPPIGAVIDAAIIAQQGDATILVTQAGSNKRRVVEKAVEQLEQTGTPFLGILLNKVDTTLERYGSYGSYGDYGNYGKKAEKEKKKKPTDKRNTSRRSRERRN